MTENAGIGRLWQGFRRLSERDKDLVVALAETVRRLPQDAHQFVLAAPGGKRAFLAKTRRFSLFGNKP